MTRSVPIARFAFIVAGLITALAAATAEAASKGGTWIDCKGSCKDTLREETVDFWETQREKAARR